MSFLDTVRNALDEYDDTPGNEAWVIRDSDRFSRILLTHMLAASMASVERSLTDAEELTASAGSAS